VADYSCDWLIYGLMSVFRVIDLVVVECLCAKALLKQSQDGL
jgi:hypothetical protein